MIDTIIERGVALYLYVLSHKRRVALIVVALLLVYIVIRIWSGYVIVNISVSQPQGTTKAELFTSESYNTTSIGNPGLHILPRQSTSILVRAGTSIRTQTVIDIPWYSFFATKHIDLKRDKNADKIAYRSTLDNPCGTYSKQLDKLLQYGCGNVDALTQYNAPATGDWGISTVANNLTYPDGTPVPYTGGVIGLSSYAPPGNITSVSDTGKVRSFSAPDQIAFNALNQAAIYTDQVNVDNNRFVVVANSGGIYLGAPKTDPNDPGVTYREIAPPSTYNSNVQQTFCTLRNTTVMCYRGLISDDTNATGKTGKEKTEITKIDFNTNTVDTFSVDNDAKLIDFAQTNDGKVYGLSLNRLYYFEQKGNQYTAKEVARDASAMTGGDKLYFIQDNGIFTFDPTTRNSYQVFYSHNITPKKVMVSDNKVFFIGKSVNSDMYSYAWRLNNESDLSYGSRYIDLLPTFSESLSYGNVDLVGNTIHIEPLVSRSATAADVAADRSATLDYLKLMGIDTNQLTVNQ